MIRNPRLEEFQMDTKPSHRSAGRNLLHDPDTGTVLGRTPEGWCKYTIYYSLSIKGKIIILVELSLNLHKFQS